jgi:hypothetical protein
MTSEASQQLDLLPMESDPLTLSLAVSPAKTSRSLAARRALEAHVAASGARSSDLLASYDRDSSSWKTSQTCLVAQASGRSMVWPSSRRPGRDRVRCGVGNIPAAGLGAHFVGERVWIIASPAPARRLRWEGCWPSALGADQWGRDEFERLVRHRLGMAYPPAVLVEYLMGFPIGWTASTPSETPSSRKSQS